ncbi:unnamed protein product [Urochloa decumbens]|uniref:Uncharacterized protein n=1 Tax=Urochloa decumbens TaxID=240449 RepID=A0ABC8WBW9_9POAL
MACLHHLCLVASAAISLLLLAVLAPAASAGADPPAKKPGMRFRYANKEESRWLDRYAETHEPLGAGPLRMRPATEEESQWLNRISSDDTAAEGSLDGEGGGRYIEFDEDNPYVEAVQAWARRLIKEGLAKAQAENLFLQDL